MEVFSGMVDKWRGPQEDSIISQIFHILQCLVVSYKNGLKENDLLSFNFPYLDWREIKLSISCKAKQGKQKN